MISFNIIGFKTEENFVNDIILTISTLLVRTEFCKKVDDAGGLELLREITESFISNEVSLIIHEVTMCKRMKKLRFQIW